MTGRISPKIAILAASSIVALLVVTGVVIFLFTGESDTEPQAVTIGEPVSIELPAEEAASVTHESGARIEIPAGSTTESTTVFVAEVEPPESDLEVRRAFDFSIGDVDLTRPVTIHIPFELETGKETSALHALHWSEEAIDWEPIPGTVDESARTIAVTTSNLSIFSWAWVKVDASCDVSPGTVEAGESFTVTATGTSLTSGNFKLYMKPDIPGPVDLPDQPEAKSEIATVGTGEQFHLSVASALEIPGEHQIECRIFWETIVLDIELTGLEPPTALLNVEGEGQFMHRVDLALKAEGILQLPIYVGDTFGIGLEVENLGDEPSIPFDLVAYLTSAVDGSVTRVNPTNYGHGQEAVVGAGEQYAIAFDGLAPKDLPAGDYVVCVAIEYADTLSRDFDTSNDRTCLDKYVMHYVEGAMPIYTTLTETRAGHRVWTGMPRGSGLLEPGVGLGFADDSGIRDDETLKGLYKRLAMEIAFREALESEHEEQHVAIRGLIENVNDAKKIVEYINNFCEPLRVPCGEAMTQSGLLKSGVMDKIPESADETGAFVGQSISGTLLFGDLYFSMLVNQALDMKQASNTLVELYKLPLGQVWEDALLEAQTEVAFMDKGQWEAMAVEIVNNKDEILREAAEWTAKGLKKYAAKKGLLHKLSLVGQKALAHSLGVKITGSALGGPGFVLFVLSTIFADAVYDDVQESQDQIGIATLASFVNAAFTNSSHSSDLREAVAYAKYVAYDNFYKADEGFVQEIQSWITFRPGDHDLFSTHAESERDKALEELKALVSLDSVQVSPGSITLDVGKTQELRVAAFTGSGKAANTQDFEWTSSAPGIASVSEEGIVTGVAPGEATITVSAGEIRGSARVTVSKGAEPLVVQPAPSGSDRDALIALYNATGGPNWDNLGTNPWLVGDPNSALRDWHGVRVHAGDADRVWILTLRWNCLRGELPSSIGNLTFLESLFITQNEAPSVDNPDACGSLEGPIPASLGNLTNLRSLYLTDNNLSGAIPSELGNSQSGLEELYLANNRLSGGIPASLSDLRNLYVLDLSGNRLQGQIPDSLADLHNLEELKLSGGLNKFTGCIPLALFEVDDHDLDKLNLEPCGEEDDTVQTTQVQSAGEPFARNPAEDFNALAAAGNNRPWGIWSDGVTMWVSDEADDKIYAFVMSTKERDPSSEFDTLRQAGNDDPRGIWSDGTTLWVADWTSDKIFAYDMVTRGRVPGRDFDTLNAAGNNEPEGIWSDGATMWVADQRDRKIYAYDMITKERLADREFNDLWLAENNYPRGIWSDGVTMWLGSHLARLGDGQIRAYGMVSKKPVPENEFDSLSSDHLKGIWSDGTTMWVVDGYINEKIYAYNMPAISAVGVVPGPTPFARVPAEDFELVGGKFGLWSDGTTMWVADNDDHRIYAYDMSTKERASDKELGDVRGELRGIWSDGTTMWVADWRGDKIFAYDMVTGERAPGKDFNTLSNAGNNEPEGIWSDGMTMWVADQADNRIYAYDMTTKFRALDREFDSLVPAGSNTGDGPRGLWSDGVTMWVVSLPDGNVYAYDLATKTRVPGKDLRSGGNEYPWEVWSDGSTLWVSDSLGRKIYAYDLPLGTSATPSTSGIAAPAGNALARNPAEDFNALAAAGNNRPWGIWSDGVTMWVSDPTGYRIFAYNLETKTRVPSSEFDGLIFGLPAESSQFGTPMARRGQHVPGLARGRLDRDNRSLLGGLRPQGGRLRQVPAGNGRLLG